MVVAMTIDVTMLKSIHLAVGRHQDLDDAPGPHVLFQTSTIDSLLDGSYDGDMTVAELVQHGDTGVGTFNACDGELILVDGQVFRARIDGTIEQVGPNERTPFAVAVSFSADRSIPVEGPVNRDELLGSVDASIDSSDCYAVRIRGQFSTLKARSVAAQRKPYPPLAEVVAGQALFDLEQTTGTMVGFRFPNYAQGINVAGYHLHYLSSDLRHGGHVMDFTAESGSIEIDHSVDLHVELPRGVEMAEPDGSTAKRSKISRLENG